ncbi:MAG: hypothetical protein ACI9WC_000399 [Arenicella sp.]|jgi:hypothetical protein
MPAFLLPRTNHRYLIARYLKSLLILSISLMVAANGLAKNTDSARIKLHLPVNSALYPDQITEIKADFRQMELNNITIETVDYAHDYQQGLRAGRIGIYFAPPHFAAWAIDHHGFQALVHLSEPLSYVIAVERSLTTLFEVSDLAGKRICARKPLNLDYLLVNKVLQSSLMPAQIKIVDRVSDHMNSEDTLCEAFLISGPIFDQFEKKQPDRFIKLYQTDNYPNYGLISHPKIKQSDLEKIKAYFLLDRTQRMLGPLLREFAKSHRLVPSSAKHYPRRYWQDLAPYWQVSRK